MPHPSTALSSFARRDTVDKLMFGFVQGVLAGVPNTTIEKALSIFAIKFSLPPEEFNVVSQRVRYGRMLKEFYEDQSTSSKHRE